MMLKTLSPVTVNKGGEVYLKEEGSWGENIPGSSIASLRREMGGGEESRERREGRRERRRGGKRGRGEGAKEERGIGAGW